AHHEGAGQAVAQGRAARPGTGRPGPSRVPAEDGRVLREASRPGQVMFPHVSVPLGDRTARQLRAVPAKTDPALPGPPRGTVQVDVAALKRRLRSAVS